MYPHALVHTNTEMLKKSDAQPWAPAQTNTKGRTNVASVFGKKPCSYNYGAFNVLTSLEDWHPSLLVLSSKEGVGALDRIQQ